MTTDNKYEQIWQSINDYEDRHQFVEEEINVGIAFQIRALRNRETITQGELAKLMGLKQSWISALENPNNGNYSLSTLLRLAKTFDVGLLVRFVPFSKLVDLATNLTPNDITPPNFNEEQEYRLLIDATIKEGIALLTANNPDPFEPNKQKQDDDSFIPNTSYSAVDNLIGASSAF